MKTLKIFFLLLFVSVLTSCGQQKKYVSYTVKKGETIRSIARENGMKTRDLMRLNPDVSKRPSANTVIIIPNKNYGKSEESISSTKKTHTVLKKESLFSISQKYGVTVEALKKENDLHGSSISVGRVLIIPEKEEPVAVKEKSVEEEVIDPSFITHKVVKDDTVFNLTRRYQISEDTLYELNPSLKEGLKLGMVLIVGKKGDEVESSVAKFQDEITDKELKILLMLPYKLKDIAIEDASFEWDNKLLNIVTDFHAGALIAIDSLQAQGMKVTIDVVDTENNSSKIAAVLREKNMREYDAVIGPLFMKNARFVAKNVSIPVIAPIYSKSQASVSDRNLIKAAPNKELLEDKVLNYMLANYQGEKIIVIGDEKAETSTKINQIINRLKSHDSIHTVAVIRPNKGYIKKSILIESLNATPQKNWVLLVGNDPVVATDVVNNLGVVSVEDANIQLFSFGKGFGFDNVSNTHLARLQFTFSKEEYVDVLSVEARSFSKMYKKKNYIRPSYYATKGFDITYDVLMRLAANDSFNHSVKKGISKRVETKFDYTKKTFGSVENKGVFLLQYQEDLELKSLE